MVENQEVEMQTISSPPPNVVQGSVSLSPPIGSPPIGLPPIRNAAGSEQSVTGNPGAIIKQLLPGALYDLDGCLLIYKNSSPQGMMSSMTPSMMKSAPKQEHNFFYIGKDEPILMIEHNLPMHPYENLPRDFFNNKNIKDLKRVTNPKESAEKMIFSPFFGYQFGLPQKLVRVYGGAAEYYYLDQTGTPKVLKVLPPPPPPLGPPPGATFFHAPPNRKGPSAKNIRNGEYFGNDLNAMSAKKGGKSNKNRKIYINH